MQFVDEAVIEVEAGKGGNGALSFRRARNLAKGGPDGGNGGNGGSVQLVADGALNTLVDFRFKPRYRGANGGAGRGQDKTGADGGTLAVRVPVGTTVLDEETRTIIGDLRRRGETLIVAHGGRRGFGNAHFKSSTNRAPRRHTQGAPGDKRRLRLELRVVADVGLLGMPNAGKSTLLARVSASRPKIADYPFTTLVPHLGVVRVDERSSFVMADVPGLIRGAANGAGLGFRFLKHLSRARLLLHLVDAAPADGSDPVDNARSVEAELFACSEAFRSRDIWLVASKADLPEARATVGRFRDAFPNRRCFDVSAVSGHGVDALVGAAMVRVVEIRQRLLADAEFAAREQDFSQRVGDHVRQRMLEAKLREDERSHASRGMDEAELAR